MLLLAADERLYQAGLLLGRVGAQKEKERLDALRAELAGAMEAIQGEAYRQIVETSTQPFSE